MLLRAILRGLYDYKKFGLRPWFLIYFLSVAMPFGMILLFNFAHLGQTYETLFDIALNLIGFYALFSTIAAIAQLFWATVKTTELTGDKLLQLILTYFYMLFAFAGIYLVLYFNSDFELALLEASRLAGTAPTPPATGVLAFSGIDLRMWSPVASPAGAVALDFHWVQLPYVYLDMLYFSMSTLTTLGYGDIVAKAPFVKMIVIFEAVFGNLLLVLGVASVVPHGKAGS